MEILVEQHDRRDLEALDRAWTAAPTFAFLPEKSSVAREWVRNALDLLPEDLITEHFALLTSGSTGTPKLVIGERRRAAALARTLHEVQRSEPVAETLVALPLSYCYAFVNQWLWAREHSRRLVPTPGLAHPDELRNALAAGSDAMLCLVGTQAAMILDLFSGERFPGVIRLHFAGGAFPQRHLTALAALFPNAIIFNNYGCAEAMPRLTVRPAVDANEGSDIGPPIPGVELRTGDAGQIEFRSRYGAVGFVDEHGFHRVAADEWLATGDLGESDERGHWHIRGRANEVFKRYGEKVAFPSMLQSLYGEWRGVAAFYRECDPGGEEGHVLVLSPPPTEREVRTILQIFRQQYSRAQWPLRIESAEALPSLPNGKPDVAGLSRLPGKTIHWRQRL